MGDDMPSMHITAERYDTQSYVVMRTIEGEVIVAFIPEQARHVASILMLAADDAERPPR